MAAALGATCASNAAMCCPRMLSTNQARRAGNRELKSDGIDIISGRCKRVGPSTRHPDPDARWLHHLLVP
jgi:hypothetical protein